MRRNVFFLHEEVIDIFHELFYIPTIEKLSFHLAHVRILASMEFWNTRNDCYHNNALENIKLKKNYAKFFSKTTDNEIKSQHWKGNRQLSMEGIVVEYFTN